MFRGGCRCHLDPVHVRCRICYRPNLSLPITVRCPIRSRTIQRHVRRQLVWRSRPRTNADTAIPTAATSTTDDLRASIEPGDARRRSRRSTCPRTAGKSTTDTATSWRLPGAEQSAPRRPGDPADAGTAATTAPTEFARSDGPAFRRPSGSAGRIEKQHQHWTSVRRAQRRGRVVLTPPITAIEPFLDTTFFVH